MHASDVDTTSILLILGAIVAVTILLLCFVTIPGQIAAKRGHPNRDAIRICQWCGLLFWPLWLVALVWAMTGPDYAQEAELTGPGAYRIDGVDAAGNDVSIEIRAASLANAEVKAQQRGITPTACERVG